MSDALALDHPLVAIRHIDLNCHNAEEDWQQLTFATNA